MAEDKGSGIGAASIREQLTRPKIGGTGQSERQDKLNRELHQPLINTINERLRNGLISPEQHAEEMKKIRGR